VTTALLFAASLALIVVAAELFTNAVEWAGFVLGLGAGATGSLLAALGTALPETVVPVVAIASRQPSSDAVAMGAIVGAPFLLLTLGMGVTGVAVLLRRRRPVLEADAGQLRRDLGAFAAGFALLALAVVLPLPARVVVAVALLGIYAGYVIVTLREDRPTDAMPEPLHLLRWSSARAGSKGEQRPPRGGAVALQLVGAVAMLVLGADLFVRALDRTSTALGVSALVLSLVLVPLATEFPETFNSVLWVRSDDDRLALGNIAGATAFQACLPGALGVVFTPWRPGAAGLINGTLTALTAAYTLVLLRDGRCQGWRLVFSALPWVGYVVLVLVAGERLAPVHG